MKKVKILSLVLALVLALLCMASCGGNNDDTKDTETTDTQAVSTDTEAFSEPETITPAPDVRVDDGFLSTSAVVKDGKVFVTVSITGNPGFAGFKLRLNFDTAVLCPVNVEGEGFFSGAITSNAHQSEDIVKSLESVTAVYYAPSNYTGDGPLYTAEFDIRDGASGSTEIGLEVPTDGLVNETLNALIIEATGTTVELG